MLRPYNNSPLASCICPTPRVSQGFTLIELMIAVAIVGILAAVALPSYQRSIMKGRRVDAKAATLDLAAREERYFSVNNTYTNSAVSLGYATAASAGAFTVVTSPTGTQVADTDCYAYKIDQLGVQSNVDASGNLVAATDCW